MRRKGGLRQSNFAGGGLDVRFLPLDVTDESSIQAAAAAMERSAGRLDALVNNAGILYVR